MVQRAVLSEGEMKWSGPGGEELLWTPWTISPFVACGDDYT